MASRNDILVTPPRPSLSAWPAGAGQWIRSARSEDPLGAALVLLLAIAWLLEGARTLLGLPHAAVGLTDVAELGVCVWLLARVARSLSKGALLLIGLYAVWLLSGAVYSHAPAASSLTGLKDALILPLLAGGLAVMGTTETRARTVIVGLLALCSFEFVLTLIQLAVVPGAGQNADLVVGSFGSSANAVIGVVTLLACTVGLAGYVTGAYRGGRALQLMALLSLIAAWSGIKLVPLLLPIVTLAVGIPALVVHRTTRSRVTRALLASLAASGVVLGFYAVFQPGSLTALTSGLGNYVSTGSISSAVPGQTSARLGRFLLVDYANAGVEGTRTLSGTPALRIYNASDGDYTADFLRSVQPSLPLGGEPLRVREHEPYRVQVQVEDVVGQPQTVQAQIEWRTRNLRLLRTSLGAPVALFGRGAALHLLTVGGVAPSGATYAVPKVAVTGNPRAGAAIDVVPAHLAAVSQRALLGSLVVANYVNSSVSLRRTTLGLPALVVEPVESRDYTAWLPEVGGRSPRVSPGRDYVFAAKLSSPQVSESVRLEIAWSNDLGQPLGLTLLPVTRLDRATDPRTVVLRGRAPAGASSALLKIAVLRSGQSSALDVYAAAFGSNVNLRKVGLSGPSQISTGPAGTGSGPVQASAGPSAAVSRLLALPGLSPAWPHGAGSVVPSAGRAQTFAGSRATASGLLALPPLSPMWRQAKASRPVSPPPENPAQEPVLPGHLTLLHMALTGVSGNLGNAIFGHGLGSATVAAGLGGVRPQDLPPYAAAASYSDDGTILYERGWVGVVVVVGVAAALMLAGIAEFRRRPQGQWSSAFSLAIPAAVLVMAVYGLIGTQLQNRSTALTFWLIVGLGLPAARPWRWRHLPWRSSRDGSGRRA